jgi:hypothetical protein
MHLFSAEQKNALHRFQITPTDIAEFICQCIRSYAFSLRTLRRFPPGWNMNANKRTVYLSVLHGWQYEEPVWWFHLVKVTESKDI